MTVAELIEKLKTVPHDADVGYVWDGAVRSDVESVWLARNGKVVLADSHETVYDTDERPVDAPDEKTDPYWGPQKRS